MKNEKYDYLTYAVRPRIRSNHIFHFSSFTFHLFSLAYDIDHALGHDDDFHDLLAVRVAGGALVGADGLLDGGVVGIGGKLHLEAGLAVEGHAHLHLALDEVLLVPLGPLGVADGALTAEHLP